MNKEEFTPNHIVKSLYYMMAAFRCSIGEELPLTYPDMLKYRPEINNMLLGMISLVDNTQDIAPEGIHNYWMEWAKVHQTGHASIIPFSELSASEKMKDAFMISIIRDMLTFIKT